MLVISIIFSPFFPRAKNTKLKSKVGMVEVRFLSEKN